MSRDFHDKTRKGINPLLNYLECTILFSEAILILSVLLVELLRPSSRCSLFASHSSKVKRAWSYVQVLNCMQAFSTRCFFFECCYSSGATPLYSLLVENLSTTQNKGKKWRWWSQCDHTSTKGHTFGCVIYA